MTATRIVRLLASPVLDVTPAARRCVPLRPDGVPPSIQRPRRGCHRFPGITAVAAEVPHRRMSAPGPGRITSRCPAGAERVVRRRRSQGMDRTGTRPRFDVVTGISTGCDVHVRLPRSGVRWLVAGEPRRDCCPRSPLRTVPGCCFLLGYSTRPLARIRRRSRPSCWRRWLRPAEGRRLYVGTTRSTRARPLGHGSDCVTRHAGVGAVPRRHPRVERCRVQARRCGSR
jgi:hypothetical protein